MYNSFAIAGKMNRAKADAQQYSVQSVPMIFVDGKFVTATDKVGTHAGAAAGDQRTDRQGARRTTEVLTVPARGRCAATQRAAAA